MMQHLTSCRSVFKFPRFLRLSEALALAFVVASVTGCTFWLQPGSKGYDNSKQIWVSTEHVPQTVQLIDTRINEVIWERDIPPGHWLVTKFLNGFGDNQDLPDRLKFKIVKANTPMTVLYDGIDVPPSTARRWEVIIRDSDTIVKPPVVEMKESAGGESPAEEPMDEIDLDADGPDGSGGNR